MNNVDIVDRTINRVFYNLFKNKSIEQVVEEFPSIKEGIINFLNQEAERSNLSDTEKENFIKTKYSNAKIIKLVEDKWFEKNKQRINYLTTLLQMNIYTNMTNEEAKQVEQELLRRMKEDFELDRKIDNFEFDLYMKNFEQSSPHKK